MQQLIVAFTSRYNRLSSVLINKVHIYKAFTPTSSQGSKPSGAKEYNALWDTGATGSVITRKVVDECGLKPISRATIHHANGTSETLVYLISIFLPNNVCFNSLRVTEGKLAGDTEVLIGMDIIGKGDFAVTNYEGKTAFSFRLPSTSTIDFVKEIDSTKSSNPPMNRAERRRQSKKGKKR